MKNLLDFKLQLASAFAASISGPAGGAFFVVVETTEPDFAVAYKTLASHSDVVLCNPYDENHKLSISLLAADAGAMGADVSIRRFVDAGLVGWLSELQVAGLTVSDTLDVETQKRIAVFGEALWAELPQHVNWATCPDGSLMMKLAVTAKVDEKKLIGAAAECARLVLHRAKRSKEPGEAVKMALAYSMGLASAEELKTAIEANDRLTVEVECQESKFDATLAASCRPECVVQSVVASAVGEANQDGELYREMPTTVINAAENAVRSLMQAVCANIVRAHIELTPALEAEIGRHNNTRTPWA
jgi:hypothetical protein